MGYLDTSGLARFFTGLKNKFVDQANTLTTAQIQAILESQQSPVQVISAELSAVLNVVYPVGSYYITDEPTSPAVLFGGTWERVTGRFLLGATDNGSVGNNLQSTDSVEAGSTGGEATHTLLRAEIAEHYHLPMTESGEYGFVTTIATGDGFTRHTIASGSGAPNMVRSPNALSRNTRTGDVVNEHDLPHNNMPPFVAVYIWHRLS